MSPVMPPQARAAIGWQGSQWAQPPRRVVRLARIVILAVVIGLGISHLYFAVTDWSQTDASAYWTAAMRLLEHQELYPVVSNVEASSVYRYSPWFAWATVPFTYLPVQVAGAIWSAILVAASFLAVLPLARRGAWIQVGFFFPILIGISAYGNVHALLIAVLVWTVERRSGPLWIGVAASLKIFPILFALTYLGRGEWLKAAVAVVVTGLLWAPALLFDLTGYVTSPGEAGLFGTTAVYLAVGALTVAGALAFARTRFAWLASALSVVLVGPRLFIYDVTYFLVGADTRGRDDRVRAGASTRG
jgi:hypothetical protein